MKIKLNISAFLMAILVFVATNGLAISEHICRSSNSHSFSLIFTANCGMEKPVRSCCAAKKTSLPSKKCCHHKQVFSKLNYHGFIADPLQLKPYKISTFLFTGNDYTAFINPAIVLHDIGIPPPDNLQIKFLLRPTAAALQNYRC